MISPEVRSIFKEKGMSVIKKEGRSSRYLCQFDDCGHAQLVFLSSAKNHTPLCKECMEIKRSKNADKAGLAYLGASLTPRYGMYRALSCGHVLKIKHSHAASLRFRCKYCVSDKINKEASDRGMIVIGASNHAHYRNYQFIDCRHIQRIKVSAVRKGVFECQACECNRWKNPSSLYAIKISVGDFSWIKVGYSNNIPSRVKGYKLHPDATIDGVYYINLNSGEEAVCRESAIHKLLSEYRINKNYMRKFMKCGFSECFLPSSEPLIINTFKSYNSLLLQLSLS